MIDVKCVCIHSAIRLYFIMYCTKRCRMVRLIALRSGYFARNGTERFKLSSYSIDRLDMIAFALDSFCCTVLFFFPASFRLWFRGTLLAQIWAVQQALGAVTPNFSIAAAFGNVHGVYKPGNVKLNPGILATHQASCRFSSSAFRPYLNCCFNQRAFR